MKYLIKQSTIIVRSREIHRTLEEKGGRAIMHAALPSAAIAGAAALALTKGNVTVAKHVATIAGVGAIPVSMFLQPKTKKVYSINIEKKAGKEIIKYKMRGNKVTRIIESQSNFLGAKQPNKEVKFFVRRDQIRDFASKQAIRRKVALDRMKFFKKMGSKKAAIDSLKKLKQLKFLRDNTKIKDAQTYQALDKDIIALEQNILRNTSDKADRIIQQSDAKETLIKAMKSNKKDKNLPRA